jgi:hypothetical protein
VTLAALRNLPSKFSIAFVAACATLLASCGGGGAATSPSSAGALALTPGTSSIYAGVPYTMNITGGRKPYLVTSSEQTIVALNFTTESSTFDIVANNPGVVDPGLDPAEVPRRTVTITVRDSLGTSVAGSYAVLQNFFTGYGASYSNTCAVGASGPVQACSGTDTVLSYAPVSQGALYGNREMQFDRVRGDFSFVPEPPGTTPQLVDRIRVRTDTTGRALIRMRVGIGAPSQIATFKVTDVTTGVTADIAFLISGQAPTGSITLVPGTAITFTGSSTGACGWGSSDQYVYDGTPPYTITPPVGVSVVPLTLTSNGAKFTVSVGQGAPVNQCPSGTLIVTDAQGRRATLDVKSEVGTTSIPITVAPVPLPALTCTLNSTQAVVIGGVGSFQVVSNHPRVNAQMAGNVLVVQRAASGDGAVVYPTTASIAITDGATVTTVTATVAANCP